MFNRKTRNLELALEAQKSRSFWQDVGYRFIRNKKAIIGLILLGIIVLMCLYGAVFLDYEKDVINQNVANKLQTPNSEHWFGTDTFGRDIFNRIVYGARYSLLIGFSSTLMSLTVGSLLGVIAGYFGGKVDSIIMRSLDIFMSVPDILFTMAVVVALGANAVNLIIALHTALKMLKREGLENIFARHRSNAILLRNSLRNMGLKLFVDDDKKASYAVTSVYPPEGVSVGDIRNSLKNDYDIIVANGQNDLKDKIFRIGTLGFVSERDILTVVSALNAAINKLKR